jgi:hypothetical protein
VARRNEFNPLAAVVALAIFVGGIVWGLSAVGVIDAPSSSSGSGHPSVTRTKDAPPEKGDGTKVTGYDEAAAAKDYPGDDAPKAKIARWMGDWAARSGLPRELPVMAALVESSLHNDRGGDRDSVGYFQMRTGIWLKSYPGYPTHPERQLKWFITKALEVQDGRTAWNRDPSRWGEWCADVERPEDRYRGRYQQRLPEARRLLS